MCSWDAVFEIVRIGFGLSTWHVAFSKDYLISYELKF